MTESREDAHRASVQLTTLTMTSSVNGSGNDVAKCGVRQDSHMTSPENVARLAVQCAREAVDRLVAVLDPAALCHDDGRAALLAVIDLTRKQDDSPAGRVTWEGHAALELLLAAQHALCPRADDAAEPGEQPTA